MKRLVICCDGTWNDADRSEFTNVSRLARAVVPLAACGVEQIVYYQSGVGTGGTLVERLTGGALGIGLTRNVRLAYAFIVDNYLPGDELFLFGFSRGAYTARSVGGLLKAIGIVTKGDLDFFDFLWAKFKTRTKGQPLKLPEFPDRIEDVPIKCIGVWDTVGSLGIPDNIGGFFKQFYRFLDTDLGDNVAFAYQALALDEERPAYAPTVWTQPPGFPSSQVLEQVWFAGVHSNVGGGYAEHGLSDVTLAWMAGKVEPILDLDRAYLAARQDRSAGWGLGRLYDSDTGLFRLGGRKPRTPLASAPSGVRHESIHLSVSVRLAGSKAVPSPYASRALRGINVAGNLAPLTPGEAALGWPGCPPIARSVAASTPPPTAARQKAACKIEAKVRWNWTGVYVVKGVRYRFTAAGVWQDCLTRCGPGGYESADALHRFSEFKRRDPSSNWFALIGAVEKDPATQFRIGVNLEWTATASGMIYCFANDVPLMYFNNIRSVVLMVDER